MIHTNEVILLNEVLLLTGSVILICILLNNFLEKLPVPSLIFFIALGMLFGEDGIFRIEYNNYGVVQSICSVCLIAVMFYGGFGTNIRTARPVILPATAMATLGVLGTAGAVTLFAHYALGLTLTEGFLIGAVISSTDAASVFSILRSQNLALKYHTDSLLEIESGSNDPISYMLTIIAVAFLQHSDLSVPLLVIEELVFGIGGGLAFGWIAVKLLHSNLLSSQESHTIFLFGIMLLSYAVPTYFHGNGFLGAYLCGIWIGNSSLPHKKYLIHFFDVLTNVAHMQIFFLLGLLVTPHDLPSVMGLAVILTLFLALLARPLVSALVLAPFRPKLPQLGLIAWSGLRGVASIVFALIAILADIEISFHLFNLIFCMVILSIAVQGTFLPWIARKLSMIDKDSKIGYTFNDYQEDSDISFIKIHISEKHRWCDRTLADLQLSQDLQVAMILRGERILIPNGRTKIRAGDLIVLAARSFEDREHLMLREHVVELRSPLANKPLSETVQTEHTRIILVKRGMKTLIPTGRTIIRPGDILVITHQTPKKVSEPVSEEHV